METITVGLEDRSYPIYIGTSLDCGSLIRDALPKVKDLMVVTNETVGPLYFDALKVQLEKAALPLLPISAVFLLFRSQPHCLPWLILQLAARPPSIILLAKT